MAILLVFLILIFLIVVHELGHFIAAKLSGVHVEEFGIGYPPRAFTIATAGGTEYTINWLPFGGFVKLVGEDGKEELTRGEVKHSFAGAARWKQAIILIAGVVGNGLAAWLLFTSAFVLGAPAQVPDGTPGARIVISSVVPASPAEIAGVQTGDEVKSIIAEDGTGVATLTPQVISEFVAAHAGKPLLLTYERTRISESGGQDMMNGMATISPAHGVLPDSSGRAAMGIAMVSVSDDHMPLGQAIIHGATYTVASFKEVAHALWKLAYESITGQGSLSNVVGPIGLVDVVGQTAPYGAGRVLSLAAFISLNLVIINLLPIPALDGGRLFFLGIESIIRRPLPEIIVRVTNTLGFALIVILMVAVTYNDIVRLIV